MSLRLPYNNENNTYFHLTLGEKYSGIGSGDEYAIFFTYEQTGYEFSTGFTDESLYPNIFNRFYITTNRTGTTDAQNIPFNEQGWYKYEVYLYTDRVTQNDQLEFGMCYIYDDEDNAGNTPDDTETYIEQKNKYVYSRT